MGSELTCPCTSNFTDTETTKKEDAINETKYMIDRLAPEDIIYQYSYGLTKVYIIKTRDIEKFFHTRSLLKLSNNIEVIIFT